MTKTEKKILQELEELKRENEELLHKCRLLESNENEFIWLMDRDLKFKYLSPGIKGRLGFEPEELLGKNIKSLIADSKFPAFRNIFMKLYRKVYEEHLSEFPGCFEFEFIAKDGSSLWFELVFRADFKDKQVTQIHGSACDITTRKQAQLAIDLSHNAMDVILDGIDSVVFVSDINTHKILFANKYAQQIYGDLIGKECWDIYEVLKLDEHTQFCDSEKLFDSNGKPIDSYIWEYKNAITGKWYEITNKALRWVNGKWVRLEIANEITSRKKDEKRLLQMVKQQSILSEISMVFNKSQDIENQMNKVLGILGGKLDISRIFVYEHLDNYNAEYAYEWCSDPKLSLIDQHKFMDYEEIGFPIDNLIKTELLRVKNVHKSDLPNRFIAFLDQKKVISLLAVPFYQQGAVKGIVGFEQSEEEYTWMVHESTLLKTLSSIMSVVYDRQYAHNKLIESETRLKIANAAKDKFFSIIAHDLKNPFSNLLGISELLMSNAHDWDTDKIKTFAGYLNTSAQQGFDLLSNLLEWSRSQTGRIAFKPRFEPLFLIVEEMVNLLSSSARAKKIELRNKIERDLVLNIDKNMMATIFRNLISNAIKFTPKKGTVTVFSRSEGDFVNLIVADTGVGMAKEDQEKLFKIDVNHSTQGTNKETGTGLGLIICKEFTEKHGGTISVSSKLNEGSEFIVHLPLHLS